MRSKPTPFRVTELLIAVAVVVGALIWAERAAWRQISRLRSSMTVEQLTTFRSADHVRAAILDVRAEWRRGVEMASPADRALLEQAGATARSRIAEQLSNSTSSAEQQLGHEIQMAFDAYFAQLTNAPGSEPISSAVNRKSARSALEKVLSLTDRLAAVNHSSAEAFVLEAHGALTRLQRFLFTALIALLAAGGIIVALAYQRTIAPMQQTLSENRAIIERQEKLASLGIFAAGIAHEIRNPLTAIKVRLFSLKASHTPGTSERDDTEVIESEIGRLERIVREFLQFARPSDPVFETISSGRLLRDTADLLAAALEKKNVQLELDVADDEPLRVDPDKMKQVLINLVQNAAESSSTGGVVVLRSRASRELLTGTSRDALVLDIVDAGKGMPIEVQKRLFDPFFTTKEEGTGLGLPISARIVEKHGGIIRYVTQPGEGTTFSIVLPKAQEDDNQS